MFLHKLRVVANFCQKQGLVRDVYRNQLQLPLPSISIITRQFASRFADDDDDDYVPRTHRRQSSNRFQSFSQENSPYQKRQDFRSKFDENNDRFSKSNNRFNSNQKAFENNNRFSNSNNRFNSNQKAFGLQKVKWDMSQLEEIQKDFYQPHEKTLNRSDEEVAEFHAQHEITVPRSAPKPILDFDELTNVPEPVLKVIQKHNFQEASPIQAQAWPIALSGKNMVGIAQTGSGKTLGFILPAIVHILNRKNVNRHDGPIALVMAPTRELAQQIQEVANQFGIPSGVRNACCFGGASKMVQVQALNRGCQLVIGTPGRLIDLLQGGELSLKQCSYLVLDEADRMLDMGFEPQIRQIINQTRPDRQTLMFSATWPKEVRNLAEDFLNEYVQVNVGSLELSANHNIKQIIKICTEATKNEQLQEIIDTIYKESKPDDRKMLIFTNTKRTADKVAYGLERAGIRAESIHSDKSQFQRESILSDFRNGRIEVMVATEVAARGLDVNNIKYVINYDYPMNSADYIHRIGRTGRSGNTGTAYSLLTNENGSQVRDLIEVMREANQEIDPELLQLAQQPNRSGGNMGSFGRRAPYQRNRY